MNAQQKAIQSLWKGRCMVQTRVASGTDPDTGRTIWTVQTVAQDVPCRLSYSSINATDPYSGAAMVTQSVKLFLDPAVPVPAGSKLTITQNGATKEYTQSGEPAVYTYHKEIVLELFERWA